MFAVVFPIAPLLALINNFMELKQDFIKLARSRRPPFQERYNSFIHSFLFFFASFKILSRSSIGAWFTCLSILNYAAVLSNCYLLCIVSSNLKSVIPVSHHYILQSDYAR